MEIMFEYGTICFSTSISLWASLVSLFPSCFSNAIFEMLLETPCMFHISPLNILDVIIYELVSSQLFSYINKKLLHAFDDFSVWLDCEKWRLESMDILVVFEDGMCFVQMASRSKTFIDFDADWGETIPYEGRYGLNHFSTIYCV